MSGGLVRYQNVFSGGHRGDKNILLGGHRGGATELLETIGCFYYALDMDKFTIDFIREKIDEAAQQNPGVRALNVSIEGKFYSYMISYDIVDRTVSGVIMQRGHKRRPINLSDILTK